MAVDYGRRRIGLAVSDPLGLTAQGITDSEAAVEAPAVSDMSVPGAVLPVPRYRESGTPYDRNQPLTPFGIELDRDVPTSGLIATSGEYEPMRGVVYWYNSGAWNTVVRDLVVALTQPGYDEIAYVVVTSVSQQNHATNVFSVGLNGRHLTSRFLYSSEASLRWIGRVCSNA